MEIRRKFTLINNYSGLSLCKDRHRALHFTKINLFIDLLLFFYTELYTGID